MGKDKKLREEVKELSRVISGAFKRCDDKKQDKLDLVECEKCGCLLKKETAIKGKSEVRLRKIPFGTTWVNTTCEFCPEKEEEYIHEVYYCKIHKPKNNK